MCLQEERQALVRLELGERSRRGGNSLLALGALGRARAAAGQVIEVIRVIAAGSEQALPSAAHG